jgi:hypothetical protein
MEATKHFSKYDGTLNNLVESPFVGFEIIPLVFLARKGKNLLKKDNTR